MLFVLSERSRGLTPERLARHEAARSRIAALSGVTVETVAYEMLDAPTADALVLSGSDDPWALHRPEALERLSGQLLRYPGPVLGICAGMQTLVRTLGGATGAAAVPVHGFADVTVVDDRDLLAGLPRTFSVRQAHDDEVTSLPSAFRVLASSASCAVEAVAANDRPWWGTQFHPEAWDDDHPVGRDVVERFVELARGAAA
jgi:GMP synthase-like glutamine amidotransferase